MHTASRLLVVDSIGHDQRIDNFLISRLKGIPKSCLYRLLRQGKIRVNQHRCKPTYRVIENDSIRLPQLTVEETPSASAFPSPWLQDTLKKAIIFENEGLIIINKPYGLAVHGGSGIALGLIESMRCIYPTLRYLELVHRLDKETSGCLLLAKKPSTLKKLHALFREKSIKKSYLMLTKGHWPKKLQCIDQPLQKNRLQSGERMVKVSQEGQPSLTQCLLQQHFQTSSLVKAILHTGRTHQIRVHAKSAGHPIAGDEKYGDKVFNQLMKSQGLKRLFLHAHQLAFTCPHTQKPIRVTAVLPLELQKIINTNIKNTEGGT